MKNLALTCKLFDKDAYYFIKPIADIEDVKTVFVYRDNPSDSHPKVKYINTLNFPVKPLRFLQRLIQMVSPETDADTDIYIGIYELPHGFIAYLAGKLKGKPVVVNIIGNPAYTKLRKGFRKKLTYWMLHRVSAITTTGSKSKHFLVSEGFDSSSIYELPNSIDVDYFKPIETINKKYDIINIGRLSPEKRLLDFVKIISIIQKKIPDIKVAIAGKGPEKDNILREISHYKLENNIELLGFVEDAAIVEFFNSGKLFIMCSETEGFPRTVIQSLACGTPCIATEVGDMADLIIHGKTGFLVNKPDDYNAFVTYVIRLLKDTALYNEMYRNGLYHVREKYSHEAATAVWKSIFTKISQ